MSDGTHDDDEALHADRKLGMVLVCQREESHYILTGNSE